MAVGTRGDRPRGRLPGATSEAGAVERRVFVHAAPRTVWATLHDPAATRALFPELHLEPAGPTWPAAATTRSARARLGLLRDLARV
jgi:hypothetical protein